LTPAHPVRLVVEDDLRRSRPTVFFRFFLAIPHFLWAALIGSAVAVAVFVNWFVLLVRGETPGGLHDFVGGFVRYVTHVEAYLFLAANPWPPFYPFDEQARYPVTLEIDPPVRQNRWTVLFRIFLAIPALLIAAVFLTSAGGGRSNYSIGGGIGVTAAFLAWWYALFRGRSPRGLRDLVAWGLGYSAQTSAYLFLLTDRYPYSGPEAHLPPLEADDAEAHPVTVTVTDDLRRSRLTVFFRLLLAVPHLVWLVLWTIVALFVAIANWLATLVLGRSPRALAGFLSAYVRYASHVNAFLYLIGNPFPGFAGAAGYPIDVGVVPGERQNRWAVLFRGVLAVPALLLAGSASGVLVVAGLLGWFASLVRARMPEGLRNAGAWAIGYSAQTWAYALLVVPEYPDSTPRRLLRGVG
jgi:hypothetical protein